MNSTIFLLLHFMISLISSYPTSNFSCGGVPIHYPFWSSNTSSLHDGYPIFNIACKDETTPTLRLLSGDYTVTEVDYDARTVSLVDGDVDACQRPRRNLTLKSDSPLRYTGFVANITFMLHCTYPKAALLLKPCIGDAELTLSYVAVGVAEGDGDCEEVVVAPVKKTALTKVFLGGATKAVAEGFLLGWDAGGGDENCRRCEEEGRKCAYGKDFQCLYEDEPPAIPLPPLQSPGNFWSDKPSVNKRNMAGQRGQVNEKKKVIIGVSVAIGGGLLLSTIFFFMYRLNGRRKRASSAMLLRASSSEPSSKKDHEMGVEYPTQTFSYGELEEATDGFSASQELGDGGFGTVYKGKLRDGRTVAVKRLYQNNYKRLEQFINEIHILSRLRHQNLVTLYGCSSRQSRELLLVYEYVPNGTVADHLHGPRASEHALTWPIRLSIAIETAGALAYLHATEPQIIHRDVKTTNILLDTSFHVKVADFGLSRLFPVEATHVSTAPQGTPGYVDPEYHQCYQLTDKSDVFSFGVVLVELISSKPAVDISRHRHEINLSTMAINKIQKNELDQLVDPTLGYQTDMEVKCMITQVAELAFRCLQTDREMRPAIKEVLEVLKGIENGGEMREKMVQNEAPLLKSKQGHSPKSVQDWLRSSSTATTNSSG